MKWTMVSITVATESKMSVGSVASHAMLSGSVMTCSKASTLTASNGSMMRNPAETAQQQADDDRGEWVRCSRAGSTMELA